METIEQYIKYAINNGLEINDNYKIENRINKENLYSINKKELQSYNIIEMITSKQFLEAVTKGVIYNLKNNNVSVSDFIQGFEGNILLDDIMILETEEKYLLDYIAMLQAIAIRDSKLEEFIKNL